MLGFHLLRHSTDYGATPVPYCYRIYFIRKGDRLCRWYVDLQLPWARFGRT